MASVWPRRCWSAVRRRRVVPASAVLEARGESERRAPQWVEEERVVHDVGGVDDVGHHRHAGELAAGGVNPGLQTPSGKAAQRLHRDHAGRTVEARRRARVARKRTGRTEGHAAGIPSGLTAAGLVGGDGAGRLAEPPIGQRAVDKDIRSV